jgi:hypothetical protein
MHTRGRRLLQGRRWPIGPKLVFDYMAAPVPEIIDDLCRWICGCVCVSIHICLEHLYMFMQCPVEKWRKILGTSLQENIYIWTCVRKHLICHLWLKERISQNVLNEFQCTPRHISSWNAASFEDDGVVADILTGITNAMVNCLFVF